MKQVPFKNFSVDEHETWRILYARQAEKRSEQIIPEFSFGLEALGFKADRIPDLNAINKKLKALTGWQGVAVEGFEEFHSFYEMLANKQFPIGNFIRDRKDLSYTPAPDVFHDLYGHIPFLATPEYAHFNYDFGRRLLKYTDRPQVLREFERLYWFSMEFALIETPAGRRIFGAGIASSHKECAYALSTEPEVVPFDIEVIRQQDFRIDILQPRLFCLKSRAQLYQCLDAFEKPYL